MADERPKSNLTEMSDGLADSELDFPRNSHRELRAKPCCGNFEVAAWSGAVPNTYEWTKYVSCLFIIFVAAFVF